MSNINLACTCCKTFLLPSNLTFFGGRICKFGLCFFCSISASWCGRPRSKSSPIDLFLYSMSVSATRLIFQVWTIFLLLFCNEWKNNLFIHFLLFRVISIFYPLHQHLPYVETRFTTLMYFHKIKVMSHPYILATTE